MIEFSREIPGKVAINDEIKSFSIYEGIVNGDNSFWVKCESGQPRVWVRYPFMEPCSYKLPKKWPSQDISFYIKLWNKSSCEVSMPDHIETPFDLQVDLESDEDPLTRTGVLSKLIEH
jgi:hypothetical protein